MARSRIFASASGSAPGVHAISVASTHPRAAAITAWARGSPPPCLSQWAGESVQGSSPARRAATTASSRVAAPSLRIAARR